MRVHMYYVLYYVHTLCGVEHDPPESDIALPQTTHELVDVVQDIVLHQGTLLQVIHHLHT